MERCVLGLYCTSESNAHFCVQLMPAPTSTSDRRSLTGAMPGRVTSWSEKRRRWATPKRTFSAPVSGSSRRVVTPSVSRLLSAMRSLPP